MECGIIFGANGCVNEDDPVFGQNTEPPNGIAFGLPNIIYKRNADTIYKQNTDTIQLANQVEKYIISREIEIECNLCLEGIALEGCTITCKSIACSLHS